MDYQLWQIKEVKNLCGIGRKMAMDNRERIINVLQDRLAHTTSNYKVIEKEDCIAITFPILEMTNSKYSEKFFQKIEIYNNYYTIRFMMEQRLLIEKTDVANDFVSRMNESFFNDEWIFTLKDDVLFLKKTQQIQDVDESSWEKMIRDIFSEGVASYMVLVIGPALSLVLSGNASMDDAVENAKRWYFTDKTICYK